MRFVNDHLKASGFDLDYQVAGTGTYPDSASNPEELLAITSITAY